jgi:hypothetical protein
MEAVVWLGLLGSGLFGAQEGKPTDAVTAATSPWLSERERWIRTTQAPRADNSLAWLDMMSTHTAAPAKVYRCGPVWMRGLDEREWIGVVETGIGYDPAFAEVLLESLKVRISNLSPCEKGRQLVRLIRPWMKFPEIHALFGESESVLRTNRGSGPWTCFVYCDYGVTLEWSFREGFRAIPQEEVGSDHRPRAVWEWLAACEAAQKTREPRNQADFIFIGFMR